MDSVTCCYLFGHKDLVESHLKAAARSGCREGQGHEGVRWWQGGGVQKHVRRDDSWFCSVAWNSWWTCEAQSPVKILIYMAEGPVDWKWNMHIVPGAGWPGMEQSCLTMCKCKPFNQSEVLFCWILNTGSVLHVSSEFIKLRNSIASNWLATLISINMIQ